MAKWNVGAGILSIITESLYDKPIVVFREYIQNSVDALDKVKSNENRNHCSAQIWLKDNDLFFLDNGTGIDPEIFDKTMRSIADSGKKKAENLGYKGIGRLSGIPYCGRLSFINIIDYKNSKFQKYDIDCNEYRNIQKSEKFHDLDFDTLMDKIGQSVENPDIKDILSIIREHSNVFNDRNAGFLVVLKDLSPVLKGVICDDQFLDNLGWLLPVPFLDDLVAENAENDHSNELFSELVQPLENTDFSIPAKPFKVYYDGVQIFRPIQNNMLRSYLCKSNLDQYAVCIHAFSNKKIEIDRKNPFSGIRIYIDNMLLCDENELIPALQQYGLIRQGSTYEVIQSVRGIGAMIYITDKVSISANARRTFIDVTDEDSFDFLALIGEFVDSIFKARYALSGYESAKRKDDFETEKLGSLRENALNSLEALARSDITLEVEEKSEPVEFRALPKTEQKRIIKNAISKELNSQVKQYLSQAEEYSLETCFNDFKTWLGVN